MFGLMGGQRVAVQSSGAADLETILKDGVRDKADVSALASQQDQSVDVMVWNYHDDDLPAESAAVELSLEGIPANQVRINHYRVDKENSNSYEVWKQLGSPQSPTPQQYAQLEKASELQLLKSPEWLHTPQGRLTLNFDLPRQGVSLLKLTW
jgi:xylan 1,4-beta-xylosidase